MKGNSKLGITLLMILILLLFPNCMTIEREHIQPSLPDFGLMRPSRPSLLPINDDAQLPVPVLKNIILLQGYARELEAYADGWEEFYEELKDANRERDQRDN